MARLAAMFSALLLVIAGIFAVAGPASAAPCAGKYDIVVGGLNNNNSDGFAGNINQRVGYNSYDIQSGANELNRLVREHRGHCPGDHISAMGHSGGAAVVHLWIEQQGNLGNMNAVLLADPKRAAGPGLSGFADEFPFNLAPGLRGTNANFRGVPVLTVCNNFDHICNRGTDWNGYFNGVHGDYDFNVDHYSTTGNGVWYR